MSKKLDELRRDFNTQIPESINSEIQETILPSLQKLLSGLNSVLGTNVDSRSSQLSRNTEGRKHQSAWANTQTPIQMNSHNHPRSRDSSLSSLDCREDPQSQDHIYHASQDNSHYVQETTGPNATFGLLTRLADVLVGMNTKQSPQTLMVRPVSTTTLTFDGKSEKIELFEDLFHTMVKMQPEMIETMKINHFYSLLRKSALQTFRNIKPANRQTLEEVLAVFRRKYVKPESQATAKHRWHK